MARLLLERGCDQNAHPDAGDESANGVRPSREAEPEDHTSDNGSEPSRRRLIGQEAAIGFDTATFSRCAWSCS